MACKQTSSTATWLPSGHIEKIDGKQVQINQRHDRIEPDGPASGASLEH
jgi:hypothetical protein